MATLKLNKKNPAGAKSAGGKTDAPQRRAPLRGQGVNKPRPTLAQAQADRAEREAAFQQRRAEEGRHERRGPQGRDERRAGPGDRPPREGGYGDRQDRGPRQGGYGDRQDRGPRQGGYGDRQDRGPRQGGHGDRQDRGPREGSDRRPDGDRPRFEGDRPRRDDRGGDRYGDRPARPHGDQPRGDRPHGDRPYGDRPPRDRAYGDRPQGDRNFGDRPRRDDRGGDRYGDRHGDRHGRGPEGARQGSEGGSRHGDERMRRAPAGDRHAPASNVHARAEREERAERTDRPRHPDAPRQPAPVRLADPDAGERLSKRMSELGLASRREADEWIEAGWVTVDGQPATLGQRVGPDAVIAVDPAAREQQAQRVTILLHKPIGYVSGQAEDGYEPASVLVKADTHWSEDPSKIHWAPGHGRQLAPAGRLDIDSTGLLVLTQDGRIARHLIGEDSDVEKEYLVRVAVENGDPERHPQHQLDPKAIALLNHGLELDGVQLKPAKVSWANEDQLRFVLREGRKRQIRRMCELVGLKVLALKRVRIGRIPLGQLPPGQWRYLAPWERF
ncbi:pseudouridine synthase [Roseateles sp.]|uniref:pseudouridine synthase n=1 Tax=Roseateles sp. TaxID=1971397 RepID=UPI0031CDBD8A